MKALIGLWATFVLASCSSAPRIMKPLEAHEINNEIEVFGEIGDGEKELNLAKKQAIVMANAYFKLQYEIGMDSILRNNIVIMSRNGALCTDGIAEYNENNVNVILYGCIEDKSEHSWVFENIIRSHSEGKSIVFLENNTHQVKAYYSANHTYETLVYGGGIEYTALTETKEMSAYNFDKGFGKTIPDRSLIFVRTSSNSNTPTVMDVFQFLTNKYFLNLNYIMTKDKSFWKLAFDYTNNKNYIVKMKDN